MLQRRSLTLSGRKGGEQTKWQQWRRQLQILAQFCNHYIAKGSRNAPRRGEVIAKSTSTAPGFTVGGEVNSRWSFRCFCGRQPALLLSKHKTQEMVTAGKQH